MVHQKVDAMAHLKDTQTVDSKVVLSVSKMVVQKDGPMVVPMGFHWVY